MKIIEWEKFIAPHSSWIKEIQRLKAANRKLRQSVKVKDHTINELQHKVNFWRGLYGQ